MKASCLGEIQTEATVSTMRGARDNVWPEKHRGETSVCTSVHYEGRCRLKNLQLKEHFCTKGRDDGVVGLSFQVGES